MKKLYSVKSVVHLSTALLFIFILSTVIYSCRKELKIVPLSATDSVDAARSWYESTYPVNNLLSVNNNLTTLGVNNNNSTTFDYSQNIKPDWAHNARYRRFGKDVIEMPVDPSRVFNYGMKNNNTGQLTSPQENSRAWFLLLNDGKQYSAYIMVLIGDPSYINGDPSRLANNSYRKRDANFSGMLLYFTPKGKFIRSYKYVNGNRVTATSTAATTTSKQTQSTSKTTNELAACIDWYMNYYANGVLYASVYQYTTCTDNVTQDGTSGSPSDTPCEIGDAASAKQAINVVQNPDPDPTDPDAPVPIDPGYPDPGDDGCSSSSPADTVKNSCIQVTLVNSRAADPMVATSYSVLLGATNQDPSHSEYGVSLATPNWNGGAFKQPTLNTDNLPNTVKQPFTWNSTAGYVIAFIHSHPAGNALSPSDIIILATIANTSPELLNATAEQQQYYKDNVSTTAVSNTGSYQVTIHDWGSLQNFYNDWQASTPDANGYRPIENQYLQLMDTYQRNNPTANNAEASMYALMTVMGNSINLYYSSPNTTSFSSMVVGSDGIVGPKNCN